MNKKRDVETLVVNNAICSGCGACSLVCNENSIVMSINQGGYIVPKVDFSTCINCGLCIKICPSLNNFLPENTEDPFVGNIMDSYVGYATDSEIRRKSQSGGIVSALLTFMIDTGKIERALINKFDKEKERNAVFSASTKEEIIDGCGSYYCQSSVVSDSVNQSDNRKYAAVCLGCQSTAFENLSKYYKKTNQPTYKIGLFCVGNYSTEYIKAIQEKAGIDKREKLNFFRFKNKEIGGWPGPTHFKTNKQEYIDKKNTRLQLRGPYEVFKCEYCYDQLSITSDISVGDPWGLNVSHGLSSIKDGYSVILARTEKGLNLLKEAAEQNYISIKKVSKEHIINGQTINNRAKNNYLYNYQIGKKLNLSLPPKVEIKDIDANYKTHKKRKKRYLVKLKNVNTSSSKVEIRKLREEIYQSSLNEDKFLKIKSLPKRAVRKIIRILKIN